MSNEYKNMTPSERLLKQLNKLYEEIAKTIREVDYYSADDTEFRTRMWELKNKTADRIRKIKNEK